MGIIGIAAGALKSEVGNIIGNVLGFPEGNFHDGLVGLSFKPNHPYAFYPGIMQPLSDTGGFVFPYRPSITMSRSVQYSSLDVSHSLIGIRSFKSGGEMSIEISGEMSAQSVEEARYLQAALHFLRTASLMSFGQGSMVPAGMPPPVLNLSAYGQNNLRDVPCVLNSYSSTYPNDVDYVRVAGNDIPSHMSIITSLTVQMSPEQMRNFNLDSFAFGDMQNMV